MKAQTLVVLLLIPSLAGCGVTLSPVKRKPVQVGTIETVLPVHSETLLVRFEETLTKKPLPETVWDNATGAFWDIEESHQIGYTQNYAKLALVSAAAGASAGVVGAAVGGGVAAGTAGGAVGGAVGAGTAQTAGGLNNLVDTRIVVPFGRIFTGVFQSGLERSFPKAQVCFDAQCEVQNLNAGSAQYVVRVKIQKFEIWENPLNHINLSATVVSTIRRTDKNDSPQFSYETTQEVTKQSIWSGLGTSSDFIKQMNQIANKFAENLAVAVLQNGMKVE